MLVVGLWRRWLEQAWNPTPGSIWAPIVACVVLPVLQIAWWSGFVGFLNHTHPEARWYADPRQWSFFRGQVEATVHVELPWPFDWLMGHAMEHTAHHAAPGVPLTALPECQRRLAEAFPAAIPTTSWRACLRAFEVCKLYDYEGHRWIDFEGRPLS
jgi:omega-6 fatty acid desaturase (delta-12 desaturase)